MPDYVSLWAGRGVVRSRKCRLPMLVKTLVAEIAGA